MYFHTQLPGSYKTFGRNADVFWCCTGTGMENHVRYGQSVFFAGDDELYVCQFFPASLNWTEKGLKMEHTYFYGRHVSNVIPVYGMLPEEKEAMLRTMEEELKDIPKDYLAVRPERGNEGVALINGSS